MTMLSRALRETITVSEVAQLVLDMFAAGLRRPKEMPSDEALVVKAYHRELCELPLESIRAVVAEYCSSEADFIPTAGKLAVKVKIHAVRQRAVTKTGPCGDPNCDCAGDGWYVGVIDAVGPVARIWPEHVARMKGLRPVAEVTCPHEGCHCHAVVVRVPTSYERYPQRRTGVSTAPVPIATVRAAGVTLPTMELWLWECEASRIGAEIVQAAA